MAAKTQSTVVAVSSAFIGRATGFIVLTSPNNVRRSRPSANEAAVLIDRLTFTYGNDANRPSELSELFTRALRTTPLL